MPRKKELSFEESLMLLQDNLDCFLLTEQQVDVLTYQNYI